MNEDFPLGTSSSLRGGVGRAVTGEVWLQVSQTKKRKGKRADVFSSGGTFRTTPREKVGKANREKRTSKFQKKKEPERTISRRASSPPGTSKQRCPGKINEREGEENDQKEYIKGGFKKDPNTKKGDKLCKGMEKKKIVENQSPGKDGGGQRRLGKTFKGQGLSARNGGGSLLLKIGEVVESRWSVGPSHFFIEYNFIVNRMSQTKNNKL